METDTMRIIFRVSCLVIGYLFGMIQSSYILGRLKGIDIREHGSGNAGTTNTLRVLGRKAGLVVFVCDLMKIFIPVMGVGILVKSVFPEYTDMILLLKLYVGLGGVIGHNFPFYLGFRGGKGIAATGGMILGFNYLFIPFGFVAFFGTLILTHYVSLCSLILISSFLIELVILCCTRIGAFSLLTDAIAIEMICVGTVITALGFFRHSKNIKRLINHEERKTYLSKKNN